MILLTACATPGRFVPVPALEAAQLLKKWGAFQRRALAGGKQELFYRAEASRHGLGLSGTLSVLDDPGKLLLLRVEGPLGIPLARADWDGRNTTVETFSGKHRVRKEADNASFGRAFGIPLSARSLSLLFLGVPESLPPESLLSNGGETRYLWSGGALSCDFDNARGLPLRVVSRGQGNEVEVRYLDWSGPLPSRIRLDVASGGSAELDLIQANLSSPSS